MFPENVVQATFQRVQTKYMLKIQPKPPNKIEFLHPAQPPLVHPASGFQPLSPNNSHTSQRKKKIENVQGMNILGIFIFLLQKKKLKFFYYYVFNIIVLLGIIVFCTGFGIVISQLGEKAKIIVDFFIILEAVIMRLVETLMW